MSPQVIHNRTYPHRRVSPVWICFSSCFSFVCRPCRLDAKLIIVGGSGLPSAHVQFARTLVTPEVSHLS
jgi:hypothetical protein